MAIENVLYSTSTWLSHKIVEKYYQNLIYCWCSPCLSTSSSFMKAAYANPPSSTPFHIYYDLHYAVQSGDRHNAKIASSRTRIRRGASIKRKAGVISANQERDIIDIVAQAQLADFRPLVYVIPIDRAAGLAKPVRPARLAHPLSVEYLIKAIPVQSVDIIELAR